MATSGGGSNDRGRAGAARWHVPREGRLWLLTAALLLGVGLFKNINLLTLLGSALLAVVVLNLVGAGRRLRGLKARRTLPEEVFAGAACPVRLQVTNAGPRACRALRLEDAGPAHSLTWFADRLPAGATASWRGEVAAPARGVYRWGPVVAVSGYPFGLVQRRAELVPAREVVALPRLGWVHRGRLRRHLRGADPRGDRVRASGRPHRAAQAEFHGLRPFRPGDSPRAIHWRTSARHGELMVREYEDLPGEDLILAFDPTPAAPEAFEAAVSLAATVAWEWCRHRGDRLVLVVPGPEPRVLDDLTGPEHARRVLECLALQQPAAGVNPAPLLARLSARGLPAAGVLLVAAAGPSRLADALRAGLRRPVTCLDATALEGLDFYSPPSSSGS